MAPRPAADKDNKATSSKPAAKKATKKTARPAADRARRARETPNQQAPNQQQGAQNAQGQPSQKDGPQVLKEGVSRFLGRGRELISQKGPGLLTKLEHAAHAAIDHTSKGLSTFEKVANEAEAKVGQGLKDLVKRRRDQDNDKSGPTSKGPKP